MGPGLLPGAGDADPHHGEGPGAIFAALHGSFVRHPWRGADEDPGPIPDYLIRDRTLAMYWSLDVGGGVGLGTAGRDDAGRIWDVYDAGPDELGSNDDGEPVAWFHVTTRTPASAPLPVRPFLVGCGDAVARLGTLDLAAVQVLLPIDLLVHADRMALFPHVDGTGWWRDSNPAARARVRIHLDSGRDPAAPAATPAILWRLNELDQPVVRADPDSLNRDRPVPVRFVFSDHLWPGPRGAGAGFSASLAEWNLDTVGWLASVIADVSVVEGVRTPVLLTVAIDYGRSAD